MAWAWGQGNGEGIVTDTFVQTVERTIKGVRIRRNATREEPAYLIAQEDGAHVLKSESELDPAR